MKRGLIVVLIIVWSLTVTVAQEFRILFTGNVHGALTEFDTDIGQKRGGAAVRKTVIDRAISGLARDKYMLLDAGGLLVAHSLHFWWCKTDDIIMSLIMMQ